MKHLHLYKLEAKKISSTSSSQWKKKFNDRSRMQIKKIKRNGRK